MNGDKINNRHDRDNILRAIFDQSFQFIGLMTLDGTLIDANRTAIKFAGAKEEDVIGKPFWETPWWNHSKELQEKLKESVMKVAQGEIVRFEATHKDTEGNEHIVDFSLKPVKDENGDVIYMIPEGRDVTEIKQTETELKESEEKCKSLFENAKDGILVANVKNGAFRMANETICQMLGYSKDEIMKLGIKDIHPEKNISEVMEKFNQMIEGKTNSAFDLPVKRKDRSVFYVDISVSPMIIDDEKHFAAFFRDITERKETEKELRENEIKYRSLFENSQAGIYRSKLDGTAILDVNKKFVEIFGYGGKEELIGKPSAIVYPDMKVRQDMVSQLRKGNGLLVNYETRFVKKDGSPISCLMSVKSFPEQGFIEGTIVDITDRKKIEQDLLEKSGEIEKMNKLMIGRELKMIELKKEIARLKGEKV